MSAENPGALAIGPPPIRLGSFIAATMDTDLEPKPRINLRPA
jgi:hypothetical protein